MYFLQKVYASQEVVQVNIAADSGEMGILANHVPSVEQLKPGLIEVIEESGGSKQFFRAFTPLLSCSEATRSLEAITTLRATGGPDTGDKERGEELT